MQITDNLEGSSDGSDYSEEKQIKTKNYNNVILRGNFDKYWLGWLLPAD